MMRITRATTATGQAIADLILPRSRTSRSIISAKAVKVESQRAAGLTCPHHRDVKEG